MANNSLQLYIRSGAAQSSIEQTLKDRADDFTTSLLTVINGNPVLQECDAQEVVRTALKAASMRLPIDPNLGLAYIIPYQNTKKIREEWTDSKGVVRYRDKFIKKYEPQLQIGWKGFVQLALRTRLYKTINVTDVREGEYNGQDRLTGVIHFEWIDDNAEREKLPISGYVAYFRLHDGFEKILYMSFDELEDHAKKYSKSYQYGNGKWVDDKPNMSKKTVVKLLISKWGPQSTEIQKALRADQAAMGDDDTYNYVDNDKSKDTTDQTPATGDEPTTGTDDVAEGEVVDAPAADDIDQTPVEVPATPQEPQKSVKEKAAAWTAKHKAEAAEKRGDSNEQ
jgi:recombination protein RecT